MEDKKPAKKKKAATAAAEHRKAVAKKANKRVRGFMPMPSSRVDSAPPTSQVGARRLISAAAVKYPSRSA